MPDVALQFLRDFPCDANCLKSLQTDVLCQEVSLKNRINGLPYALWAISDMELLHTVTFLKITCQKK